MERLNESHKQLLRFLVKAVREEQIPEEFTIHWMVKGPVVFGVDRQGIQIPASRLALDLLAEEGMIFSAISYETRSHGFSDQPFPASQSTRDRFRTRKSLRFQAHPTRAYFD